MHQTISVSAALVAVAVVAAGDQVHTLRDGLPNAIARLKAGQAVTVAYFGGSITAGAGASKPENCYRALTTAWLREEYPDAEIREVNAAIGGTGSELGVFRLERDVLREKPDLVFVEYAVNDGGTPDDRILRAMEGIVRHVWRVDRTTDICFLYTLVSNHLESFKRGELPRTMQLHEQVAQHYGIPSANMARAAASVINAGEMTMEEFAKDRVHPTDAGYRMYLDSIAAFLDAEAARAELQEGAAFPHELRRPLRDDNWEYATLVDPREAEATGGWEWSEETGGGRFDGVLLSDEPGDTLTLQFEGSAVGLFHLLGPTTGDIEWRIDEGEWQQVRLFDQWAVEYHRPHWRLLEDSLAAGEHALAVRIAETADERATGHRLAVGWFLVAQ